MQRFDDIFSKVIIAASFVDRLQDLIVDLPQLLVGVLESLLLVQNGQHMLLQRSVVRFLVQNICWVEIIQLLIVKQL